MAYIRVIDENDAEGKLFEVYDEIQRTRGRLSNILRIQSLDPKALKAHLDLYVTLLFGKGPLSRRERELVALVVSSANRCTYCITHHSEALNTYAKNMDWVRALVKDPRKADLAPRERAMVDYAYGLTVSPGKGGKEAVETLRGAGLDDETILHLTELVGYFNFINRMANGLGVDLEQDGERDYAY